MTIFACIPGCHLLSPGAPSYFSAQPHQLASVDIGLLTVGLARSSALGGRVHLFQDPTFVCCASHCHDLFTVLLERSTRRPSAIATSAASAPIHHGEALLYEASHQGQRDNLMSSKAVQGRAGQWPAGGGRVLTLINQDRLVAFDCCSASACSSSVGLACGMDGRGDLARRRHCSHADAASSTACSANGTLDQGAGTSARRPLCVCRLRGQLAALWGHAGAFARHLPR